MALSIPSAPQKRFMAKGKSLAMHSTTALSKDAILLLNSLTDIGQTRVSILGKIFKTTFLPLNDSDFTSVISLPVRTKAGAVEPTVGKLPLVFTVFSPSLVCAMVVI